MSLLETLHRFGSVTCEGDGRLILEWDRQENIDDEDDEEPANEFSVAVLHLEDDRGKGCIEARAAAVLHGVEVAIINSKGKAMTVTFTKQELKVFAQTLSEMCERKMKIATE